MDAETERERRARVAEQRIQNQLNRGTRQQQQGSATSTRSPSIGEEAQQRQKQELIGKIRAEMARLRMDEPFGLSAMSVDKLKSCHHDLQSKRGPTT
jgi:hypothetical protein